MYYVAAGIVSNLLNCFLSCFMSASFAVIEPLLIDYRTDYTVRSDQIKSVLIRKMINQTFEIRHVRGCDPS